MSCTDAKTMVEGTDFEKKHTPMIECKDTVKAGEIFEVKIHTAGVEHVQKYGLSRYVYIIYIVKYIRTYIL